MSSPTVAGATHYNVLNLTPSLLDTQTDPLPLIKRAYHRALLRNHPDKAVKNNTSLQPRPQPQESTVGKSFHQGQQRQVFSIDQITAALTALSNPATRAAYDNTLKVSRSAISNHPDGGATFSFQTGVETVDLDDLDFDDVEQCWYRACRCGNDQSYCFREADLEEVSDEGELIVGCLDCSLWLKVHFVVMEEEGDDQEKDNSLESNRPPNDNNKS